MFHGTRSKKKTLLNNMTNLSFPIKIRKGAGLESKMNENYHEM